MTEESFKNQPGQLSLSLRCVSSISTQKQDDAHTIETHHQKDSVHFSYGSLFFSGIYAIIHLPGVAPKSLLAQKYAFTKKSTIFTQSLRNLAKIIYTWVGYFDQVSYMIE